MLVPTEVTFEFRPLFWIHHLNNQIVSRENWEGHSYFLLASCRLPKFPVVPFYLIDDSTEYSTGEVVPPEQAEMAHNFLYSGDRRYIEKPIKPAPPPIITKTKVFYDDQKMKK